MQEGVFLSRPIMHQAPVSATRGQVVDRREPTFTAIGASPLAFLRAITSGVTSRDVFAGSVEPSFDQHRTPGFASTAQTVNSDIRLTLAVSCIKGGEIVISVRICDCRLVGVI